MASILAFDTETSGTPVRGYPPDDDCQPRLVQFAALLIDDDGRERASACMIVKPDKPIPEEASRIHGITDEIAALYGVPEIHAVGTFLRFASVASIGVAYNCEFDRFVISAAAARCKVTARDRLEWRDACEAATPIVNLPPTQRMIDVGFGDRPKKPKLAEAYKALTGLELVGAHDALADCRACVAVYRELMRRGCWQKAA
jgi:DNA polymerase-3 subunit epsilon